MQILLALFTGINAVYVLFWLPSGHFILDEGVYHMMARSFLAGHGWFVNNGYVDFPFAPFTMRFLIPNGELLAPQYPPLLPLLGAPLVEAFGLRGLILVSVLSHSIATMLTYRLGMRVFGKERLALIAALLYGVGTYAFGYSQSAFTQPLTTTCVLAAIWVLARRDTPSCWDFVLAGLCIGLGTLARLDGLLAAVGIAWWQMWSRPLAQAVRSGMALAAGVVPALAVLAAINFAKFGAWNPFSYGSSGGYTDPVAHVPLVMAVTVAGIMLWSIRTPWFMRFPRHWRVAVLFIVGLAAVALLLLIAPQILKRLVSGVLALLVDMRFYVVQSGEYWLKFGEGGAIQYDGVFKKALFQSLPLLIIGLLFGLWTANRDPVAGRPRLLLWTVAVAIMAPYLLLSWHGGLAFNQRYFLPALAALLLLSITALHDVTHGDVSRRGLVAGALIAITLFFAARNFTLPGVPPPDELALPLILSGALVFVIFTLMRWPAVPGRVCVGILSIAAGAAIAWGFVSSFGDLRASHLHRAENARLGSWTTAQFPERSIVVAGYPDPYFGNIDHGVFFANPEIDSYTSMRAIMERADTLGYSMYFMMNTLGWKTLEAKELLAGFEVCPDVFPGRDWVRQVVRGRCPGR